MVEERKRIRPWRLSDRGPDGGFFDVGGRFVVTGEKAHGVLGSDGCNEQLREECFDGGVWGNSEICRVRLWTFGARVRYSRSS